MSTIEVFLNSIKKEANNVALVDSESRESFTYKEFYHKLLQFNLFLHDLGVGENDVVTIISENSLDLVTAIYGSILSGVIAKPLNPKLTSSEIQNIVSHSGSQIILTPQKHEMQMQWFRGKIYRLSAYRNREQKNIKEAEFCKGNSGGLLIYTSGSTGTPKGVLLTLDNIVSNCVSAIDILGIERLHVTLCILPLFHTFGFISDVSTMLLAGGKAVIMETFDLTKLKRIEKAVKYYRVNSFSAVPLMYDLILKMKCDFGPHDLKFCVSGAAPLAEALRISFEERFGIPIIPAYGLTESTCFCTISPPGNIVPGSIGKPANAEIKIMSEDEQELAPGKVGELVIRGDSIITGGYFKNNQLCYTADSWFKTGDLGYVNQQGYFFITGRKKNMVIRGGEKIYLEDIDKVLLSYPGLTETATIRVCMNDTEYIVSYIVPEEGKKIDKEDLISFLEERVGKLKIPDKIEWTQEIPRTHTNKIKISQLQQWANPGRNV